MKIKNPKKKLGQNFLTDKNIINIIVDTAKLSNSDYVLEVGPGTGNLTEKIISKNPKKLFAVEKDKSLAEKLFEEKDALRKLERVIGEHPDGKPIHIRLGPFGPYLQVGEKEKGKKSPLQGPIFKSDNVEELTLEQAIERLGLPRNLGN